MILHIYADYDKRIGAYKITYILGRDYGIFIITNSNSYHVYYLHYTYKSGHIG